MKATLEEAKHVRSMLFELLILSNKHDDPLIRSSYQGTLNLMLKSLGRRIHSGEFGIDEDTKQ